ncbi:restriction endonuclease subunit S (plasmid) [Pseudomonadaceae bacterium T75]|nr:restriction endonuclease subunit S [Stutzerimonas stutzeri]WAD28952.1 restriction endonuclease subunit S [Pseudomonadaceae bacterium T75]
MSQFKLYPAYKDSGVAWLGEVPEHWRLTPIKHLALLNPRKSDYDGDTEQLCSFVPMEKLKTGVVQLDEERPIEEVIGGYTYFEDGDVLQAKVTPCFENKNVAIAQGLTNGIGFGSSEINVLRPYQGVNADYLYYRVQEDSYMSFCTSSMIGAGGLKRVPTDVINNFKIAAPTLCEQTQIARFLDHETARIDALIEEQQRLIELLKEKRQAVISHAVTKGLDPTVPMKDSGVEWLGEVPAHWTCGALARVAERVVVGIAEAATHAYAEEGVPILRATNIRAGKIIGELLYINDDFADGLGSKLMRAGDLVTVRTGNAGVTAVVPESLDGCQCFTMLITTLSKGSDPEYYCLLLNSHYAKTYFNLEGWGTAQVNISVPILKWLPVPIPPLDEQQEISKYLHSEMLKLDALIDSASEISSLLSERRSALISAAVTGKIDVRGWQPPASIQAPELEKEAV